MKKTTRLPQACLHLCDGGASCGVNAATGTPAGSLFLFLNQEVPTGVISSCAFCCFHSPSPWSEAAWRPWGPWGVACSEFLTTLFQEKNLKHGRLNKFKTSTLKDRIKRQRKKSIATPWITYGIILKKQSKSAFSSLLFNKLTPYTVSALVFFLTFVSPTCLCPVPAQQDRVPLLIQRMQLGEEKPELYSIMGLSSRLRTLTKIFNWRVSCH